MTRLNWIAALIVGIALGLPLALKVVWQETETLPAVSSPVPTGSSLADEHTRLLDVAITRNKRVFHQYIDDAGAVRFVESPDDIPAEWRDRAGRVELNVAPPSTPAEGRIARKLQDILQ